ncbi:MAG TPA: hypothetical protein VF087_01510 [Solirubrobacteraceae bacterium]
MITLRTALALLTALIAAAGATAAIVWALQRSHDGVPDRLRSCGEDRGAHAVKTTEGLASARPDVLAGRRPRARDYVLGQDRAVLLQGADYAVLVVRSPSNPPLPADLLDSVYRDPSPWALVLVERTPVRGVLARCATA